MKFLPFAIFIVLVIDSVCCNEAENAKEWTLLTFAQEWAPTQCMADQPMSTQCKKFLMTPQPTWTIHGLWPGSGKKSPPEHCTSKYPFNKSEIQSIENLLLQYWPNLKSGSIDQFWSDEWMKHGTCAISLPTLGTEKKYFSKALELNQGKINIFRMLQDANPSIVPSSTKGYDINDIEEALGKNGVVVQCVNNKDNGKQYIKQVEVCVDKTFKVLSCPDARSTCDRSQLIQYPPFESTIAKQIKKIFTSYMKSSDADKPITL